jgi:hypothetical protein
MKIPKVFISYSHDTIDHKKWVLELAIRMRNNGIDAILDQWELNPGDDLPHFMETHLSDSDKIVMVCTEKYVEKANLGKGGVGYEKMIITAHLLEKIDENKIIPLVKQSSTKKLPTFLKTKLYIDFSKLDDFEFNFDNLIRTIHNSPLYKKPPIGNNPFKEIDTGKEQKTPDGIIELMRIIISYYNSNSEKSYIPLTEVKDKLPISRILLETLLDQAEKFSYIGRDRDNDIILLTPGKIYAINNKLV